jgi:hypothetical protein
MRSVQHHESRVLDELKEFATFTTAEQRYIRCSLEVAAVNADAADHWARGIIEAAAIGRQARLYAAVGRVRSLVPIGLEAEDAAALLDELIRITAFDLEQGKLSSFAAYRFLYERLIGPSVRPWLASAFAAGAALPCIHPELRAELFASITCGDIASAGWSKREPTFFPEWVDKVPATACA